MPKLQPLIKLAPFMGLNTNTSDVEEQGGDAQAAPNADPFRDKGALCTARGRVQVGLLSGTAGISAISPAALTGNERGIYVSLVDGGVVLYNPGTTTQYSVSGGTGFSQAFQYGIPLYTNVGQQIKGDGGAAPFVAYFWQNSWANAFGADYGWTLASGTGTNLAAQTYYYAFTLLVAYPDGETQETSPTASAFVPFSINFTLNAAGAISITPKTGSAGQAWSGTLADGSTYSTNVYRLSTQQPTFLFVANVTGALSHVFNDDNSDATIASNAQLDLYRDPPPLGSDVTGPAIFAYKDRAWCFVLQQNAATNGLPQCQLWYSDYGVPYAFNAAYNVILVGNGQTAYNPSYGSMAYGDIPLAGIALSSCAILHKQESLYVLWGDDEATFVVRGIGAYGTISANSAAACASPQGDIDCWLSPEGVYACDGFSAPQYISEDIRGALDAIPRTDWVSSVGWYANRSYYLSFPATGVTYIYYFPTRKWRSLPYGTNAAYAQPANQPPAPAKQIYNQIIAARPTILLAIDAWDNSDTDLNNAIQASWLSPLSDSGEPAAEKNYRFIGLQNPIQAAGVTAEVVLSVWDTGQAAPYVTTFSGISLSASTWTVLEVPQGSQKGYLAQLEVYLNNVTGATTKAEIYNVIVSGTIDREWAKPV